MERKRKIKNDPRVCIETIRRMKLLYTEMEKSGRGEDAGWFCTCYI
jgi:hypothetical protein